MISYLLIAIGSAVGGMLRHWLSMITSNSFGETFPLGTLFVNILGSFIIGIFASLTAADSKFLFGTTTRQLIMIGFCGGFTTFSSFSLQTLYLLQDDEWLKALLNTLLSFSLCMFSVWLGYTITVNYNQLK